MTVFAFYRWFRSRATDTIVAVFAVCFLGLQAFGNAPDYPSMFRQIVADAAAGQVAHPTIERYLDLVNTLGTSERWSAEVQALYADQLYFSDTFAVLKSRGQVKAHFASMRKNGVQMRLVPHDLIEGAAGTYLVWSGNVAFEVLGKGIEGSSIGVTLFQFDEDGKIVVQQDFWDSAHGFYQYIPVLGSAIRSVRDRVGDVTAE